MVFVAAFAMMIIIQRAILLISPRPQARSRPAVRAA
jgi:hypothetical protein